MKAMCCGIRLLVAILCSLSPGLMLAETLAAQESSGVQDSAPPPLAVYPNPVPARQLFQADDRILVRLQVLRLESNLDVRFEFPLPVLDGRDGMAELFQALPTPAANRLVSRLVQQKGVRLAADTTLVISEGKQASAEISGVFDEPDERGSDEQHGGKTEVGPTRLKFVVSPLLAAVEGDIKFRLPLELRLNSPQQKQHDSLPESRTERYVETNLEMAQGYSMICSGLKGAGWLCVLTPSLPPAQGGDSRRMVPDRAAAADSQAPQPEAVSNPFSPVRPAGLTDEASRGGVAPELRAAMARLFPDDRFEMIPVPGAVVLRGTVESESLPRIVEVAEASIGNVINQLDSKGGKTGRGGGLEGPRSIKHARELDRLRRDVNELKRLLEQVNDQQ